MAMTRQKYKNDCMILRTIDELVPKDHLVRMIDECMDFTFIEDEVKDLYSPFGRSSIPPVVLFKLLIINKIFGINSMRKTCEECKVNLAYRWFLGLSIEDDIPNYSTWSKNYKRRYKDSDIFNIIFKKILKQAVEYGFVDMSVVFYDGTHQKANANKRKCTDEEVEIEAKSYSEELLEEVNKVRKEHGQKEFKSITNEELTFNEETGKEEIKVKTKHIKKSTTDPDSGDYHKGEHERCFAYTHNVCCCKNAFVLDFETTSGNVHDSVSFETVRTKVMEEHEDKIDMETLDSGYKTPAICKLILESGKIPLMPYTRPKGSKELYRKNEFVYNEELDNYICPNNEILNYSTTDRNGYKIYKCKKDKCLNCPLRSKCTKSKNSAKSISRHVWQEFIEQTDELRYTETFKEIYPLRKETIERVFGDCKENMGLRFTRVRGLKKNRCNASMIFACHNLKKMALWKRKYDKKDSKTSPISSIVNKIYLFFKKKTKQLINLVTLSTA